ncbi:MAG: hypothetical protein UT42_C0031G0004 [Candidatus Falkowbacteria bacterium GW2011_GWA2_39_24]|uniref:DUF4044 domain-containing protein n=1 Tax=Candidatus Falkowbacteria bacterium GW2011_GWA2_39_24 TaxID=1618634 RepID=A0A0G0QVD0_9BACT|nr:MAG: hypothetical protein UT42_C0031G0004 [Candidatus Falkowbacteria bacterium GW2011_GWA2_39_24]
MWQKQGVVKIIFFIIAVAVAISLIGLFLSEIGQL